MGKSTRVIALWLMLTAVVGMCSVVMGGNTTYFSLPSPWSTSKSADMWEPYIATSPDKSFTIMTTTSYNTCDNCTDPEILYKLYQEKDSHVLCPKTEECSEFEAQNDPVISINERGQIFFIWMNDYTISVVRGSYKKSTGVSFDFNTYLEVIQSPASRNVDKPWIVARGDIVVAGYVDEDDGNLFARASGDAGATWWDQTQLTFGGNEYHFPSGMVALPTGSVCLCTCQMPNNASDSFMQVEMNLYCTNPAKDSKWSHTLIDVSAEGPTCPEWAFCESPREYLLPSIAMANDDEYLYVLYGVSLVPLHPSFLYFRRMKYNELNPYWETREIVTTALEHNVHHGFPMIVAQGRGDVRIAWMDNRTGEFNVWYRQSSDGGETWSIEVRVSTRETFEFQSEKGFKFPYGDYGGITIDSKNNSIITWGEGNSWTGPGMTFVAVQTGVPPLAPIPSVISLFIAPLLFISLAVMGLIWFFIRRNKVTPQPAQEFDRIFDERSAQQQA